MCTVLLPPGVNPIAVNKYIISLVHAMKTYGGVELYLHSFLTFLGESFTYGRFALRVKAPVSIEGEAEVGSRADLGVLDSRNIPCTLPKIIIEKLIFFHHQNYIITRVTNVSTVNTSSSSSQSFIHFLSKYLSKDWLKFATILVSGGCPIPSPNFAPQPFKFIANYKAETERVGSTGQASDTCLEITLRGLSPQANYTDRAAAAGRRS
jgi:hypothetical protein